MKVLVTMLFGEIAISIKNKIYKKPAAEKNIICLGTSGLKRLKIEVADLKLLFIRNKYKIY